MSVSPLTFVTATSSENVRSSSLKKYKFLQELIDFLNELLRKYENSSAATNADIIRLFLSQEGEKVKNGFLKLRALYDSGIRDNDLIFLLGFCYGWGLGIEKDMKLACEFYKIAAEHGHPAANYNLGSCLKTGLDGIVKDPIKAAKHLIIAADAGNRQAQNSLAHCYKHGIGVAPDPARAVKLYFLGGTELFKKEYDKLKVKAQNGDAEALYRLGLIHETGTAVAPNLKMALEYYEVAKRKGHICASYSVQRFTLNNLASSSQVRQNKTFKSYLALVSENPQSSAGYNALGFCYQFGIGTKIDLVKALENYSSAAELGHPLAQNALGQCYQYGIGVDTAGTDKLAHNFTKAIEYYTRASNDKKLFQAQYNLEICNRIRLKIATIAAKTEAFLRYERLAKNDHPNAQNHLGFFYQNGIGVEINPEAAFKFYSMAAEKGDADALYNQGQCYENAIGVKSDIVKATHCYEAAARQRHILAQRAVLSLYQTYGENFTDNLLTTFRKLEKQSMTIVKINQESAIKKIASINQIFMVIKSILYERSVSSATNPIPVETSMSSAVTTIGVSIPSTLCEIMTNYVGLLEEDEAVTKSSEKNFELK